MIKRKPPYRRPYAPFPKDFAARIECLRAAAGVSWREFARRIGTDPKTVRSWRAGKKQPSSRYVLALFRLANEDPARIEILLGDR